MFDSICPQTYEKLIKTKGEGADNMTLMIIDLMGPRLTSGTFTDDETTTSI